MTEAGPADAAALEAALARLYTDSVWRQAFLAEPERALRAAGVDAATAACLLAMDRQGLVLAAHSYAAKRAAHAARASAAPARRHWLQVLRGRRS